jgi:hypothetical protein
VGGKVVGRFSSCCEAEHFKIVSSSRLHDEDDVRLGSKQEERLNCATDR